MPTKEASHQISHKKKTKDHNLSLCHSRAGGNTPFVIPAKANPRAMLELAKQIHQPTLLSYLGTRYLNTLYHSRAGGNLIKLEKTFN